MFLDVSQGQALNPHPASGISAPTGPAASIPACTAGRYARVQLSVRFATAWLHSNVNPGLNTAQIDRDDFKFSM
jgi:hypothetical protein